MLPEGSLHVDLVIRLVVAVVLGGVIGYERDLHGRPAGLRTHTMVALASATFMVISSHFVYFQHYAHSDLVEVDASRIAASVVSGIGFLAGGAIFRTGLTVTGLTTAASLWLVAAIGLSSGAGMYVVSIASTSLGVIVLTVMRRFEDKDERQVRRKLTLVLGETTGGVATVHARLKEIGAHIYQTEYEKHVDEGRVSVTLVLRIPAKVSSEGLLETLERVPGVRRVRVE